MKKVIIALVFVVAAVVLIFTSEYPKYDREIGDCSPVVQGCI